MFKKFVKEIAMAETAEQLNDILYRKDGVDMMFQKEKLKWEEHEILFKLASVHKASDFVR